MLTTNKRCEQCPLAVVSRFPRLASLAPEDFESDDVPDGYETVGHWWVTKEAEAVADLYDPLGVFYGDSEELQTLCERRDIPFLWVTAGRAMQAVGLDYVRAFPVWLLAEFYPVNP